MKKELIEGEKQMLSTQLNLHSRLFKNVIADIRKEDQIRRVNQNVNHMAWLAGSFVSTRYFMLDQLGVSLPEPFPDLFEGNKAIQSDLEYPELIEQHKHLDLVSGKLINAIENASLDELARTSDIDFGVTEATIFGLLIFLIDRESYVIGQMALLRKVFGYTAMSYH